MILTIIDPDTKEWLTKTFDDVFGYPNLVRFGWETSKRILEEMSPIQKPFPYEPIPNANVYKSSKYFAEMGVMDVEEW